MDDHAAVEGEVVVVGDGDAVELAEHDPDHVERRQPIQRCAVEDAAGRRHELRPVRSPLPAQRVQPLRLRQRGRQLGRVAHHPEPHVAQLVELPAAALVGVPGLRRRARPVQLVEAVRHRQVGRRHPLDQVQRSGRRGDLESALARQAEQVDHVHVPARRRHQVGPRRRRLAGRQQEIGERRLVGAEELADPDAQPAAHAQRQHAHEGAVAAGHAHRQRPPGREMAPPLDQPAVQQERARPRHSAHEVVPADGELRELVRPVDDRDLERGRHPAPPFRGATSPPSSASTRSTSAPML